MKRSIVMAAPAGARPMTYSRVLQEAGQQHATRRHLYAELEEELQQATQVECLVVAFFTSFIYSNVQLYDADADMLEEVLQNVDIGDRRLVLVLNCPGGSALAAERIITICRSFSKNGYSVIIPKQAKSAATMICLGAKELHMSSTSELGPIDPQIADGERQYAAHEIIEAYLDLMRKANKTKGRLEPYLQQLQRFDARDIRWIKSAQELSESVALKALATGVMEGVKPSKIKAKIKPFLNPQYTKVHGRPIYHDVATNCGLDVKVHDLKSPLWRKVWEIYIRLNVAVSTPTNGAAKIIESGLDHFEAPIPI